MSDMWARAAADEPTGDTSPDADELVEVASGAPLPDDVPDGDVGTWEPEE